MISVTKEAQAYLAGLLKAEQKKDQDIRIRIEAIDPDTPYAECGIRFFIPGPEHTLDMVMGFDGFDLFVDSKSVPYLEDAAIDIKIEGLATELVIDTPHLEALPFIDESAPLADKINFLIETEINPQLASHGGMVRFVELTEDNKVVLQFGGGCHGCGMVDVTLKEGIEKTLMEKLPEITGVLDATDHAKGENPYY